MRVAIVVGVLGIGLLLVIGLVAGISHGAFDPYGQRTSLGAAVTVWHDDQRFVTCWLVNQVGGKTLAISCLPDAQVAR